jgi:hypothetical protein
MASRSDGTGQDRSVDAFSTAAIAARDSPARLRRLLEQELARGESELALPRSGYEQPVVVVFTAEGAVLPVPVAVRADANTVGERAWLVVAATVEALVEGGAEGRLEAGDFGGHLVLRMHDPDVEIAAWAFDEATSNIDRLRAKGVPFPSEALKAGDFREPIGAHHPLKVAHAVATLGGRPSDPRSVEEHEEAVLQILGAQQRDVPRPHDDPDPARRAARRILQRLDGMGKWGGYHTEFAHLARGFPQDERALASAVGEALIEAGLLAEKPSVGQRHVFLDPRHVKEIRGLIERGEVPRTLELPSK